MRSPVSAAEAMPLPEKIVLATGNPGKVREIQRILGEFGVTVVPQTDLGIGDADETGTSFAVNALIKARHASLMTGLSAIADDSGLVVDALGGRPGVYSARYSGADATDDRNIDKLLQELRGVPDDKRTAAFHCCAVYVSTDGSTSLVAEGRWDGRILAQRRGTGGFGYDPVFFDPECGRTAAELGPELKNARSHRGKALTALVDMLRERYA
jgi:XTP/dITP diphosphohydrolase